MKKQQACCRGGPKSRAPWGPRTPQRVTADKGLFRRGRNEPPAENAALAPGARWRFRSFCGIIITDSAVDRGTLRRTTISLVTGTFTILTYIYGFMDRDVSADEGSTVG